MEARPLLFWVRWGGAFVCLVAGLTLQTAPFVKPQRWLIAVSLLHAGSFLRVTRQFPPGPRWPTAWLVLQFALASLLDQGTTWVVNALSVPLAVPREARRRWLSIALAFTMIGTALNIWWSLRGGPPEELPGQELAVTYALSYFETLLWGLIAYVASGLIVKMEADKRQLAALNAELISSRAMLAESSRMAERLDIARELHDSLGHHLTTLNLELEIAQHCPPVERDEQVRKAQFLARLLLADLRDTVTLWRRELSDGLPEALHSLSAGVSHTKVHVRIDPELPSLAPPRAHALLRCAQEALTNALRHSGASEIWIEAVAAAEEVEVRVRDNGVGCARISPGNGLTGIRTRAQEQGGSAAFESPVSGGFLLSVRIPQTGDAA
jgi:signal transduction histidine kinase